MTEGRGGQPPFVGESRHKVVEGLAALLARAQLDDRPVWVSIEAPSGWGKTRVAHALYEHLARHQARRYWPPTILDATDASFFDVASRRKRVFPEPARFDRQAGALPEFFWWGIACDMRSGAPSQVLVQDLAQIEAHALFLEAAWAALASLGERHGLSPGQAREMAFKLAEEAAGEGVGKIAEKLLGTAVPGLGLALDLAKFGFGKAQEGWDRRRAIARPGALPAAGDSDPAAEAADTLMRIARPGLPVIVFVEDLHRDTGLVAALIGQLLAGDAPVMILTTTWPGEIEASPDLAALLADPALAGRIQRLRHDLPVPAAFPAGASMDALPLDARKALIRAYYPATAAAVLDALAARYNNPLPIELICTLDRHRRAGSDGALRLSPAEIEKLPRKVEQLYRELWAELPYPVQCVLALSTLAIPASDAAWHQGLFGAAVAAVAPRIAEPGAVPTGDDVPHGWVRAVEAWLRRFNEPDQLAIARQEIDDRELFGDDVVDDFLDALVDAVTETPFAPHDAADAEDLHRAWLALTLNRAGRVGDDVALDAILLLLDKLSDGPGDIRLKLTLAPILADLSVPTGDERLLGARLAMALSFAQGAGRIDEALAMFEALLADRRALHGDDHPATEASASELINWLYYFGRGDRAVAVRRELVESKRLRLGEDAPSTIRASAMLANLLFLSLQTDEAIALFSATIPRLQALLGEDHDDVVSARRQLATALAHNDKTLSPGEFRRQRTVAIASQDALVARLTRTHGPESPEVLRQRVERLEAMAKRGPTPIPAGEVDAAIADALALIDDLRRSGRDNQPLVDRTRRSLSSILWDGDRLFDFIDGLSQRLLTLQDEPPTDIDAFWTMLEDGIYWFEDAAPVEERAVDEPELRDAAIAMRETLIETRAELLGEGDFDVMQDRIELVRCLIAAGRLDEARSQHRDFLASPHRTVRQGWHDLDVVRWFVGQDFHEAGLASEQVAALAALLEDAAASDAPDANRLNGLRHELAIATAAAGDRAGAIEAFRTLLAEHIQMFGPTHSRVASTVEALAAQLHDGGDTAEAIALWQSLIDDRRAELGADHALVAEAETSLAALTAGTRH